MEKTTTGDISSQVYQRIHCFEIFGKLPCFNTQNGPLIEEIEGEHGIKLAKAIGVPQEEFKDFLEKVYSSISD